MRIIAHDISLYRDITEKKVNTKNIPKISCDFHRVAFVLFRV